jgi:hypothetical protein
MTIENSMQKDLENKFKTIPGEKSDGFKQLIAGATDKINIMLVDNMRILTSEEKEMVKNIVRE